MIGLLIGLPAAAGLLAFATPWNTLRRALLLAAASGHAGLAAACLRRPPAALLDGWLDLDATGLYFLAVTSLLFLVATLYTIGYLARESRHKPGDTEDPPPFVDFPEAVFTGCYLLFLASMTLVIASRHWGLLWVAVEATTLASAPLIYFHRYARSLEATWKYLMICSVGIALALLANFFLAVAAKSCAGGPIHLAMGALESRARELDPTWLKAAFVLLLVGYGTKMGLAPLHTWLPDAHSEAPSMVSALLSGALLNCAFLAILRGHALMAKAGLVAFSQELLVLFGLVSMVVAAFFIVNQMDYKRMLAYSSVEHMGILALGAGIGGVAGFGSMLHVLNHSLAKALLFLAAGNTLAKFHTKSTREVRGVLRVLPATGLFWVVGLFAIAGSPPFAAFFSELAVLKGILDAGRFPLAIVYLAALSLAFVGMSAVILPLVYGEPERAATGDGWEPAIVEAAAESGRRAAAEPWWSIAPLVVLAAASLALGLLLPHELASLVHRAAAAVGVD